MAKNKPRKLPHVVKILRDGDDLIYREERGILEKELPLNKTPDVPGHVLEAARLVEAARAEMRAVYGPTVDVLFDEVLNAAEDPAEVENALGVWLGHITYKYRTLDRRTAAARFLWAHYTMAAWSASTPHSDPEEAWKFRDRVMKCACNFADAWYYWRLEADRVHDFADRGTQAAERQSNMTDAHTEKNRRRVAVVQEVIKDLLQGGKRSTTIAKKKFKVVNRAMKANGFREYTKWETLEKTIRDNWPGPSKAPK